MKHTPIIFLTIIMTTLLANSCARFKVEKLNSNELFSIPIDEQPEHLNFPEQKGLYYEVPGRVAVVDDWLVVSQPSSKMVKIFKGNELRTVISSDDAKPAKPINKPDDKKTQKKESIHKVYNKHINVPGALAAGKDDDFYLINYIASGNQMSDANGDSGGFYKILHFDVKGTFLHVIGRQGRMDQPFETILWMDTDDNNDLWVLYKYVDQLTLERYTNGSLTYSVTQKECEESLFIAESAESSSVKQCEEMYPFYNDDLVLMIGRIDKIPEKKSESDSVYAFQRRIYKTKKLDNGKLVTIFNNMNDPEDYPYIPRGSNILIWKTARTDRFKLALYDNDGNLIKFLQIDLPGKRNNWRSTYATLAGDFYSIRIQNNTFHVVQWK